MRDFLKRLIPKREGDFLSDLPSLRERVVHLFAAYLVMITTPLIAMVVYRGITVHWGWSSTVQSVLFVFLFLSLVFRNRLGVKATSAFIISAVMLAALSGLATWGLFASGPILIVGFAVIASVLLGVRWALCFIALATLATLLIANGFLGGSLSYAFDEREYLDSQSPWINRALHVAMVGTLVSLVVSWITKSLQISIVTLQEREQELEHSNTLLTQQAVQLEEQASQLEEQAETLKEERDRAQSASRAKDQFLSVVSHELRTPLNPVIGFLGILQNENDLTEESRNQVHLMQQSSEHLLKLIDQIVDFSELDRGELTIKRQPTTLRELERETVFRLANEAKQNQLDFGIECAANADLNLSLDKKRILQVLSELGENAIRFTQQGGIRVSINLENDPADKQGILRILVSDTGIGIPPEKRETIFDPFIQGEADRTRSTGGLGLGLSFCEQVLKSMGGAIQLESEVGSGTTVSIELPVEILPAETSSPPKPRKAGKLTFPTPVQILVVEDDYTNQRVVTTLLKRMGAQPTCAENGQAALDLLEQERFDAVLMDLSMPVMDGITATQEIRKRPELSELPIIALTAHSYSSSEDQCREAGMNGFLTKPVKNAKLFEALARACAPPEELPA